MPKVFPCFSPDQRELAAELAAFLERGAGLEVLLEEGEMTPGEDLVSKVEQGLSADAVLALVSPESVPGRWVLERWQSVFWRQAAEVGTAVAIVLCRDARFPDLLRRKNFFDLRDNRLGGFRRLKRWLMALWPLPERTPFSPARQPWFTGREAELESLCAALADAPGMAVISHPALGAGKTALALEFTRRHQEDFEALIWLTCGARSPAALAGDFAAQLGLRLDRDLENNLTELRRVAARHRCLLILDDATADAAGLLAPRGRTSTLITTRQEGLDTALGALSCPLAAHPPRQLDDVIAGLGSAGQRLLSAMCACAPSGFHLDMAVAVSEMGKTEALEAADRLLRNGLLAPLDQNGPRFLVPSMARRHVTEDRAFRHSQAAAGHFDAQLSKGVDLTAYWPDVQHALAWALEHHWPLACQLARRGVSWSRAQERLAEAFEVLQDWLRAAAARADRRVLDECAWEQTWILEHWGRTQEARRLESERLRNYADQMVFDFAADRVQS